MNAFLVILFLIILHQLYMYSAEGNVSNNYLPLVLIEKKGKLLYPNKISKATIDENGDFTGNTQFSKDDSNNQVFFCPAESDKQKDQIDKYNEIIESNSSRIVKAFGDTKASKNCLFRKNFKEEEVLRCADDATPAIEVAKNDSLGEEIQQCGHNKWGTLYKFVYEKSPFLYHQETVYEICYNQEKSKTIYTKHRLSSANLLFDVRLEHEKTKNFIMMTDTFSNEYFDRDEFSKLEEHFDRLSKNPITQNRSSDEGKSDNPEGESDNAEVEIPNIYLPEKLVPPEDLTSAILKKTTFHYINVLPMHQGLVKLWDYITDLIRKNFKNTKLKNPITIYTGAFTPKGLNSYYSKDWPADIPQVWVKIIYEETPNPIYSQSLVIVMKNEYTSTSSEESYEYDYALNKFCNEDDDDCSSFKEDEQMLKMFPHLLHKIRCCIFNDKVNSFFKIDLKHGGSLLSIANLTDD